MSGLIGAVPLPAILHAGDPQLFGLAGEAEAAGSLGGVGVHIGLELLEGAVQQGDIGLGGIMFILHAGAADDRTLRQLFEDGFGDFHLLAQRTLEILQRDVSGAEEGGLLTHHRHDGGLPAPVALAAVEDEGQASIHIGKDILRIGGAGLAGEVSRRGCKGTAAGLNDGPGHITLEDLERALGEEVEVSKAILEKLPEGAVVRSPGMKYKHYAPKADVTLLNGTFAQFKAYVDAHKNENPSCLCFTGESAKLDVPCVEYGREGDGADQAKHIFRSLRALDEQGDGVVYARCPQKDGLSMAVYNRLIRAAAFRVIDL